MLSMGVKKQITEPTKYLCGVCKAKLYLSKVNKNGWADIMCPNHGSIGKKEIDSADYR